MTERLIDHVRSAVTHAGGVTGMRKLPDFAAVYGVRSGSHHGPTARSTSGERQRDGADGAAPTAARRSWSSPLRCSTGCRPGGGATTASVYVVHPHAVLPAATVVAYLTGIEGNHIVSGQHNAEPNSLPAQYTDRANAITGVYPGRWGGPTCGRWCSPGSVTTGRTR